MVRQFPPVDAADESGLLAIGGDLEVATLKLAYRSGIFPWPVVGQPMLWFAPPQRAILDFSKFKIPRRLQRSLRQAAFTFSVNTDFSQVIRACADSRRRSEPGTWLTPTMIEAYIDLHRAGFALSFETRNGAGHLVGGLYGVKIKRYFAGESMFFRESNASKFALIHAVDYLRKYESTWMDIQMLTPLLEMFGAEEIPRQAFMKRLSLAIAED